MKLRIKGNSLRLRLGPSEIVRLLDAGRLEDTIHFAPAPDAKLTYALEVNDAAASTLVRYLAGEVTVLVPRHQAVAWAQSDEVSVSGAISLGDDVLTILVEKDFACLDRSDAENEDTFPHPKAGATC